MGSEANGKHFRRCLQKCVSNFRSLWLSVRAMEGCPPLIFFFFFFSGKEYKFAGTEIPLEFISAWLNFSGLVVLRWMFYLDNCLISWENFPPMSFSVASSHSFFCFLFLSWESPVPPRTLWALLYWGLLLINLLWFWMPQGSLGGLCDIKPRKSLPKCLALKAVAFCKLPVLWGFYSFPEVSLQDTGQGPSGSSLGLFFLFLGSTFGSVTDVFILRS